jgi:5-methylcytosine-specific restriction endonuclease McrBC GTP-binding regulatory subunit McrB
LNELFKDELQFKNPFSWTLYESKNMILRGAPGTGKSYLAKQIAADIVSNGNCSEYSELTDEQKKQIEFVQFHPNYDYSDFVEGLRPTKPDDEGTIGFELHPGIFSLFISRARTNFEDSQKTAETIEKEFSVQSAMKEFFSSIEFGRTTFKISSGNEFKIVSVDDSRIKINIPGNECVKLTLKLDDLRRMLESDEHFTNPSDVTKFFGRQWREQGFSYDLALYKEIKNKIKENSAVNKTVKKNYVFIIDEINRGEISKIFGELFYAIDPGYRGRSGEISTQYANLHDNLDEKFYVPDNVFIIGTMNDIDRSVDSFDFAMRRRFRFVELKASDRQRQEEMLNCLNEDVKNEAIKRMNNLNEEIVKAEELNENYQIGAAYFLKLKSVDFDGLWTDYLQPLLQEYVRGMNDEKKILNKFAKAYGYVNLSENESEFDEDTQN